MHLIYLMCAFMFAAAKSEPEKPNSEKLTANDYLLDKWRKYHATFLDVDLDEFVSLVDLEILKQDFANHGASDSALSTLDELWRAIILGGNSKLSSDEFVQMWKEKYQSDQTNFFHTMQTLNKGWFDAIDINKDGFLSVDEYVADIKEFRHKNTGKDTEFYYSHRLVHNLVPLDEAVDVWLRFETEKDKAKTDIVFEAIKYVFLILTVKAKSRINQKNKI